MTTLADIFRQYAPAFLAQDGARLLPSQHQALRDLQRCRTPALGGRLFACPDCQETHFQFHSCRNRHCPQCQAARGQQWLDKQVHALLPTHYFLLTFTFPAELRPLAFRHQRLFYHTLFQASAQATQKLAQDPRFVGGKLGLLGVLHTWGRQLQFHPHVHYLVPAGGLAPDGRTWRPANNHFLLRVDLLSTIFRAKVRDALRPHPFFAQIPARTWHKAWVVHAKPVGSGSYALQYLAPYIFRVALGNHRLLKLQHDKVTFRFRDHETRKFKTATLPALEFMRRFLLHILPKGFVKVRYFGLLAPAHHQTRAALRLLLLAQRHQPRQPPPPPPQPLLCPACLTPLTFSGFLPPARPP